ncbi:MAG: sensor domain-containing diguanylate cyclase [Ignavibacteriales bacterium]|nr:sensor domain-containing diguanylate cyclase [Ignavibacteriales bacterium]
MEKINAGDGIFLVIGVVAVVTGILVDIFLIRLICLIVVLSVGALFIFSVRAKELQIGGIDRKNKSLLQSQHKSDGMKKLIFDDFQKNAEQSFRVEEIEEKAFENKDQIHADLREMGRPPVVDPFRNKTVEPIRRDFGIDDFFDVNSDIYKGDTEPRTEFDFLLNKVLMVIKEVLFAHTAAFFWANREKQQVVLEAFVSDSPGLFTSRRFSFGHDLVSNVAVTGKPEFISEINDLSERELFCYYSQSASVRSFVGVPVYFSRGSNIETPQMPVAVLIVDSKASDEFGPETLTLLGRFTKLLSALVKSYNDKYDLLLDIELMASIRRLQERIRSNFSLQTIVQALAEESSKLVNWDFLSIVLYDESKRAWVAKKIINRAHEGYIVTEQAIDFPESLAGKTIKNNISTTIDDLSAISLPRYYNEEKLDRRGSFVSVPISSLNKCYGAVNIESKEIFNFSRRDVDILSRLADNSASALEIFYMREIINEYVVIDDTTGMYAKKFLMQRIGEELQRADDLATELSLLLITVDRSEEISQRFGIDGFERVMLTLAKAIKTGVRPYDVVGRYDTDRFAIVFVNTAANEAFIWAEKIRKTIAGLVINLDGKSFSMTISVGVAGATEGMKKEELVGNTIAILNTASHTGGNVVRVF